jgi:hypothetical protein
MRHSYTIVSLILISGAAFAAEPGRAPNLATHAAPPASTACPPAGASHAPPAPTPSPVTHAPPVARNPDQKFVPEEPLRPKPPENEPPPPPCGNG